MKKFLIMLMVVAMASFLFVGCLPTTPEVPEVPVVPVVPALTSTTPVIFKIVNVADDEEALGIIDLYSSKTQYMNEGEVEDGILVKGFAPKYSTIKVYVNGAVVGTGYSYGVFEGFTVFVAKADLGVDGAKTLYATVIEAGLDESVPSTTYTFTLDIVAPKIVSITAEVEGLEAADETTDGGEEGTLTVTCSEAIDEDTLVDLEGESTDIWNVTYNGGYFIGSIPKYDLISPDVIELSAKLKSGITVGTKPIIIRVAYQPSEAQLGHPNYPYVYITDLAGNKLLESVHYSYVELE